MTVPYSPHHEWARLTDEDLAALNLTRDAYVPEYTPNLGEILAQTLAARDTVDQKG